MNKVVIVTGVSRGIGKSIVDVLFENPDVAVYGIARSEEDLKGLKNKYGERFEYVAGDVTREEDLQELVNKAIAKHGKINSVIANAAVMDSFPLPEGDISKWKSLFDINLFGVVNLVRLTWDAVENANGNYILVTSMVSVEAFRFLSASGASKAALNSVARSIALESTKAKAIAVGPGFAETSMFTFVADSYKRQNALEDIEIVDNIVKNGKLKPAETPARTLANIAIKGISTEINGKYYEYHDQALGKYNE